MKQLKNLMSVMTVVFAVVAAFAFKASPTLVNTYGVKSETATAYVVTNLAGKVEPTNYICEQLPTETCTVTSNATPDANSQIPKTSAITKRAGDFVELP